MAHGPRHYHHSNTSQPLYPPISTPVSEKGSAVFSASTSRLVNNNHLRNMAENDGSTEKFYKEDYVGRDTSALRERTAATTTYPPTLANDALAEDGGKYPVTRGSIAAQMAAEGQIPKNAGLKMFRTDEHKGALMKGGRAKCCMRVCGCSLLLAITILVSVIAAFLLFARPPDVSFNGIESPTSGSIVAVQSNGFVLNFQLSIGVINPNFFGASFKDIRADAYYSAAPTTQIGGGQLNDVHIPKYSNSTVHFPFSLNYTTSIDPSLVILRDIATKCGFLGSSQGAQDLKVNYKITLGIKVVAIVISPSFSSSASFACPLSESDVSGLLGSEGLGGLVSDASSVVSGLTGGSSGSRTRSLRTRSAEEVDERIKLVLAKVFERAPLFTPPQSAIDLS